VVLPTRAYEFAGVKPLRHVPVSHESFARRSNDLPDEVRVKATKRGIGNGSVSSAFRDSGHIPTTPRYRETSALASEASRSSKIFHFTRWSLLSRSLVDVDISSPARLAPTLARSTSRATFSEKSDRKNEHFSRYRSMLADILVHINVPIFGWLITLYKFYRVVLNNLNKRRKVIFKFQLRFLTIKRRLCNFWHVNCQLHISKVN